jgi:hypothetical protein
MPVEPTEQEKRSAALRQSIAERYRAEYLEALNHATSLFGPGWEPHGKHLLVTSDEAGRSRAAGDRVIPEAVIISARNGQQERHFIVGDGVARECEHYQETWKEKLKESHPTRTFEHKGQTIPIGKYEIHWSGFEPGLPAGQRRETRRGAGEARGQD